MNVNQSQVFNVAELNEIEKALSELPQSWKGHKITSSQQKTLNQPTSALQFIGLKLKKLSSTLFKKLEEIFSSIPTVWKERKIKTARKKILTNLSKQLDAVALKTLQNISNISLEVLQSTYQKIKTISSEIEKQSSRTIKATSHRSLEGILTTIENYCRADMIPPLPISRLQEGDWYIKQASPGSEYTVQIATRNTQGALELLFSTFSISEDDGMVTSKEGQKATTVEQLFGLRKEKSCAQKYFFPKEDTIKIESFVGTLNGATTFIRIDENNIIQATFKEKTNTIEKFFVLANGELIDANQKIISLKDTIKTNLISRRDVELAITWEERKMRLNHSVVEENSIKKEPGSLGLINTLKGEKQIIIYDSKNKQHVLDISFMEITHTFTMREGATTIAENAATHEELISSARNKYFRKNND